MSNRKSQLQNLLEIQQKWRKSRRYLKWSETFNGKTLPKNKNVGTSKYQQLLGVDMIRFRYESNPGNGLKYLSIVIDYFLFSNNK